MLLFGVTGSGKTEVYLRAAAGLLEAGPQAQVLVLVPEINLTPQLGRAFTERFAALGRGVAAQRADAGAAARQLAAAHLGRARIVLGTRMAIFASLPRLRLIVVDEEHDPRTSQEGARYSARDLAVYRSKARLQAPATAACCWAQPRRRWRAGARRTGPLPRRDAAAHRWRRAARAAPGRHEPPAQAAAIAPPLVAAIPSASRAASRA